MTEKGVLTSIKTPTKIFQRQRDHLKAIRNPDQKINTKITEETPKVHDPEIRERIQRFKKPDEEDVAQGQFRMQLLRYDYQQKYKSLMKAIEKIAKENRKDKQLINFE